MPWRWIVPAKKKQANNGKNNNAKELTYQERKEAEKKLRRETYEQKQTLLDYYLSSDYSLEDAGNRGGAARGGVMEYWSSGVFLCLLQAA